MHLPHGTLLCLSSSKIVRGFRWQWLGSWLHNVTIRCISHTVHSCVRRVRGLIGFMGLNDSDGVHDPHENLLGNQRMLNLATTNILVPVQGGKEAYNAVTCRSLSAKEPINIGLFCWKRPLKIRHPMPLCHPVTCGVFWYKFRCLFQFEANCASQSRDETQCRKPTTKKILGQSAGRNIIRRISHTVYSCVYRVHGLIEFVALDDSDWVCD